MLSKRPVLAFTRPPAIKAAGPLLYQSGVTTGRPPIAGEPSAKWTVRVSTGEIEVPRPDEVRIESAWKVVGVAKVSVPLVLSWSRNRAFGPVYGASRNWDEWSAA